MNEKTPNQQTQAAMTEARTMARNRMPELAQSTAGVESFPTFTKPARELATGTLVTLMSRSELVNLIDKSNKKNQREAEE